MKFDEICKFSREEYYNICDCGKKHVVLTQRDNNPEYEAEVYVLCDCGEYLEFILPVN